VDAAVSRSHPPCPRHRVGAQAVGAAHIGVGLVHGMLLTFGLLSLAVAALLTLTQRDYKRLNQIYTKN